MSNYTKKALRSAGLVFIAAIIASLVAYILRIVLARELEIFDFGLFFAVYSLIIFFSSFKDIGLRNASVKFIAEHYSKNNYGEIKSILIFTLLTQLFLVSTLILIFNLLANFLANNYFKVSSSTTLISITSLIFLSSFLFMNARSILRGFQDMRWFSIADLLRLISILIAFIILIELNFGIISAPLAYITGDILAFFVLLIPLSKYFFIFKHKIKDYIYNTKKTIKFALPVIFTGIADKIVGYIDTIFLTWFVTLDQVGIYNVILPTALVLLTLSRAISSITFPMTSELWTKGYLKKIQEGVKLINEYIFLLMVPIIIIIFFFSYEIINLFFGAEFATGHIAFRILLIGVLFFVTTKINFAILSGIGKPELVTKITFFIAGLNIIINLILIPEYGIIGAAIATSISYLFSMILSSKKVSSTIKVKFPIKQYVKITILSLIFIITLVFFNKTFENLSFAIRSTLSIMISIILYIAIIIQFKFIKVTKIINLIARVLNKS